MTQANLKDYIICLKEVERNAIQNLKVLKKSDMRAKSTKRAKKGEKMRKKN